MILYAPTLDSPGAYAALDRSLAVMEEPITHAIVRNPTRIASSLSRRPGVVIAVNGHLQACRVLRRIRRAYPDERVVAAQNPVLPFGRIDVSYIRNSQCSHPFVAFALSDGMKDRARVVATSLLTLLQVARSNETVVHDRAHPRLWKWITALRIEPNVLRDDHLVTEPATQRSATVCFIGSLDRFRGAHVALGAFRASGLWEQGWQLVLHARRSTSRLYAEECRRMAEGLPGVTFADEAVNPQKTLASSAVALFPSRIEGSSIAFLEGLALADRIVALDAVHFRDAVALVDRTPEILWVRGWDARDWGAALRSVADAVAPLLNAPGNAPRF